jgi:cytidylate kinase
LSRPWTKPGRNSVMAEKQGVVTIDGPSGAGKSTISRLLAARLAYTYLDTGAMYRAVGFKVKEAGLDLDQEAGRAALPGLLAEIDITLAPAASSSDDARVFVNGKEVSHVIRTAEMGMIASRVSAEPMVRKKLTEMQRQIGSKGGIVAEGRDTGTVVFPQAEYKFYMDASPEERARRRQLQLKEKGQEVEFQILLEQITKRDSDDSARSLAPLKPAQDAVIVDTSSLSIEEVVSAMLEKIRTSVVGRS